MKISVIIVNYNAGAYLSDCLTTLTRQFAALPFEVCLVDNASTDHSLEMVRQKFPEVNIIANSENLGFSKAVNLGLKNTSGDVVMWLNPDSEILNEAIREVMEYFLDNPKVGIIGAQLINTDGTIQLSCRSFPSYKTALFNRYSLLTRLFPNNRFSNAYLHSDWNHDSIRAVDWVSGACLIHRREVADQLKGLDEQFFMYSEDVDFCLRAGHHGWAVHYHPSMKVLHHIGGSSKGIPYRMLVERHRSMWRYYAKHYRRNFAKDLLVKLSIWGRCGFIIVREKIKAWAQPVQNVPIMKSKSDEVV